MQLISYVGMTLGSYRIHRGLPTDAAVVTSAVTNETNRGWPSENYRFDISANTHQYALAWSREIQSVWKQGLAYKD